MYSWLMGEDLDDLQLKALEIQGALKRLKKLDETSLINDAPEFFFPSGVQWTEDGYRGISLATYKELGAVKVSRGRYQNRICFPVYVNGELVGVDARTLGDEQPKYLRNKSSSCKHNWLFPFDKVKAQKPKLVLLGEGLFHGINAFDKGFAGLCFFGVNNWSYNKIMMLLSLGAEEVCYFPDPDTAGYQAAQRISASLVPWFKVTYADITGYYETGEDLGDLDRERIEAAVTRRGKPQLPLCLLENWELKIEYGAECRRWKCLFNERSTCRNPCYEPAPIAPNKEEPDG